MVPTSSEEAFLKSITGYYLENLPPLLLEHFVPQCAVPMAREALPAFAAQLNVPGAVRTRESMHAMDVFFESLSQAVQANPQGSFVRMGSRSMKDAAGPNGLKIQKALDALEMCVLSPRVHKDIRWFFLYGYPPTFFVRPWINIERWRELRCFVQNNILTGISQYYCENNAEFAEIATNASIIAHEVTRFIRGRVIPVTEHDTFVCDIYYMDGNIKIIDYNPLNNRTGMCFFDKIYTQQEHTELRFRYREKVAALALEEDKI